MANINPNQFAQVPVRGLIDLNISLGATIIQGVVSANQATAMKAGDFVKMDNTTGNIPTFVAAGTTDVAMGAIVFDNKKASPVAGDYIQVAIMNGTAIMWVAAGGTVAVGASVEDTGSSTVQTLASGKMRGVALDPGTSGNLFRIIVRNATQS